MKLGVLVAFTMFTALCLASTAFGQPDREDVIWARAATGPITLDGVLDESEWAQAETKTVVYGVDAGLPGSGWKPEAGLFFPNNPSSTTIKFLVVGNELYMGAVVTDASVGGSMDWNRFDGLLMAIKDHADPGAPKPPAEHFYSWWYPEDHPDPQPAGQSPGFIGKWDVWPPGDARDPGNVANWDAVTVVDGISNDDTHGPDQGYTVEMRFNLAPMGYDVTQPGGDIVEWNIAIFDSDWFWPFDALKFGTYRVWWQSPWGNAAWYHQVHVYARPDVTTSSGALPVLEPEIDILTVDDPAPVIDGALNDAAWSDPDVYSFEMKYGDPATRMTYPGVGPYRAGQFQPPVNGGEAFVLDPADATIKMFYKGENLYIGFDVRDQVVQFHSDFNRWDGFLVNITDATLTDGTDHQLESYRLSFQVDQDGSALARDDLIAFVTSGDAQVAVSPNAGTTIDTMGTQADNGYTAEFCLDLKAIGYPAGLGDRFLFLGIDMLDGDSFPLSTDSYGTRTWWYREYERECCPVWAYLVPGGQTGINPIEGPPPGYILVGNYPNPSPRPQIRFVLPEANRAALEIFDVRGRLLETLHLGIQEAGLREVRYDAQGRGSGVYPYRVKLTDPETGALRAVLNGKMIVTR